MVGKLVETIVLGKYEHVSPRNEEMNRHTASVVAKKSVNAALKMDKQVSTSNHIGRTQSEQKRAAV
jgi:hypothetical protein